MQLCIMPSAYMFRLYMFRLPPFPPKPGAWMLSFEVPGNLSYQSLQCNLVWPQEALGVGGGGGEGDDGEGEGDGSELGSAAEDLDDYINQLVGGFGAVGVWSHKMAHEALGRIQSSLFARTRVCHCIACVLLSMMPLLAAVC